MKIKNLVTDLLVAFILASCAPATIPTLTETATPSQKLISAPSATITPTLGLGKITATPLNLTLNGKDEIPYLLNQMRPNLCMGNNLAILTPPPLDIPTPPKLKFTEIDTPLSEPSYFFWSTADNIDHSLRAYVADKPGRHAASVYVQNNNTGKIYEVYFGQIPNFTLEGLFWLNRDTFFVGQIYPYGVGPEPAWLEVAINFNKQEYVYYGIGGNCCGIGETNCQATPRSTP